MVDIAEHNKRRVTRFLSDVVAARFALGLARRLGALVMPRTIHSNEASRI